MELKKELGLNITVHNGIFHSDDVLCVVMWLLVNAINDVNVDWVRTRDPKKFDGVVADVGGGEFDHHTEKKYDKFGRTHCAASLLWEGGLDELLFPETQEEFKFCREAFYKEVLVPVMAEDNGQTAPYSSLLAWVKSFNTQNEFEEEEEKFNEAVELASKIIKRQLGSIKARASARVKIKSYPRNEQILVFDEFLPGWQGALYGAACRVVIYPSQDGGYALCPRKEHNVPLVEIPDEWVEGNWWETPEGLEFCHRDKFLVTFGNLPDAINAARWLCGLQQNEIIPEEELDLDELFFKEWLRNKKRRLR